LASEAIWIWLPFCVALLVLRIAQRLWPTKSAASPS
jgi:hypothetical protein